ncbi:hypothetical protein SAMN05421805_105363 [Saccharopolyspora antimicrobica]|uniref:Uncharacterized protein n=1 Tax=Saccharopolyspora antimicrobica TaxID=455193 RepID=A0A1I5AFB5_9PSEU|nr:hypothetical protein ATL45_1432 [Saccharopolyspora antimicrobica]SFN61070.1 hypothetical protein SAMN05421805_105363 [Saccharopolyspora antimicrobica]
MSIGGRECVTVFQPGFALTRVRDAEVVPA